MFQEIVDLDGITHTINLNRVEYAAPDKEKPFYKLKMAGGYVIKIEVEEWQRVQPFVQRL